jgi:C4-dicarboxylate transporter DctQ subunit
MRVLDHLEEWLITALMGAATLLIFVAVVHRYAAGMAIPGVQDWLLRMRLSWAQELCIIMFVWMAKFGAAYGVRTGIHVGVDVLVNRLSPTARKKVILFGLFAGAFFTAVVGTLGARLVWGISQSDQTTPDLELPSWIVYLAVPLGSYLMCFRFLQVARTFWSTGELPKHDHGHVEGVDVDTSAVEATGPNDNLHPRDLTQDGPDGAPPRTPKGRP